MKLSDHVEQIRKRILNSFNNEFGRLGLGDTKLMDEERIPAQFHEKRGRILKLINNHKENNQDYTEARNQALEELTFTLFNRFAAIKVMEAHQLFPPVLTKEAEHGDRSFGHKLWLEENPEQRQEEIEGIRKYMIAEFNKLGDTIPLFHKDYPYAFLPNTIDLNNIIDAFNAVEKDQDIIRNQTESTIWQSDDILGWLYESYNNEKKQAHKDSGDKTEYNKVSLQSQVYTPRWVVEFLVHNSLGKLYLEMYPDSEIKNKYKIANAPLKRVREPKALHLLKMIDPASGSGNFVLYGFEFFYELYLDQIENYGDDYDEEDIPKLIIENNIFGVDLDDRAIQIGQLGLWIKAKQKQRNIGALQFNLVSTAFNLPDFDFVLPIFKNNDTKLNAKQIEIIESIWQDLQNAHKFGSLVRLNEKLEAHLKALQGSEGDLFKEEEEEDFSAFKSDFLNKLETAFLQYATQQGNSFLTDKTKDAITFLKIITEKYDVATANPPYTDSGDFGEYLKEFIEKNYKSSKDKFSSNLYSVFIKRLTELLNEDGKIGIIHPDTFMTIDAFKDVRKFILNKFHINVLVDIGLDRVNLFGPNVGIQAIMYIIEKTKVGESIFIDVCKNLQEKFKKKEFDSALNAVVNFEESSRVYKLNSDQLLLIKGSPFIYWLSPKFREKFNEDALEKVLNIGVGITTGNNNRFLRYWWENDPNKKYWTNYAKGGPYKKWSGNLWCRINWENNGQSIKEYSVNGRKKASIRNSKFYFQEGITYSALGGKKLSFRYLPPNSIFDSGGSCIFLKQECNVDLKYFLGLFNSKLANYLAYCLNNTVNTQVGDLKRIPYLIPDNNSLEAIIKSVDCCIRLSDRLDSYFIYNHNFLKNCFDRSKANNFNLTISDFFDYQNYLTVQKTIYESQINYEIFEAYELTDSDKAMVLAKEGESIGALPVSSAAKAAYLANEVAEFPLDDIKDYIQNLPEQDFEASSREAIENEFPQLYQSNNDLEEFCIRHQTNPINVWYWFKEANIIPKQRMNDLAMEFLADLLREILMEDDDGIIPLVPNAGEKVLLDRIEEKFIEKGFSMAQYSSFDSVLGRELNEYINNHFFKNFSDHLNLFMYLPKTPFIWHLTSGPEQGFDCYIIIYKWSRDRLQSIRSIYIEQRERSLQNRQSDLRAKSALSASEQNELDKIYKQLKEIESFKQKIDELLAEGYNPILDDGVGKNIAPLQNKKMIAYEVLNAGQLKKYLNADW